MAKFYTVDEINDLDDGQVVTAFAGRLTKIAYQKDGVGKDKSGTLQIIKVKDKEGDEISVKAWDAEMIPKKWTGQDITILAHKSDRGWTGVFAEDSEYDGKSERILRLTKSAKITCGAGDDDSDGSGDNDSDSDDRPSRKSSRREEDDDDDRKSEPSHKRGGDVSGAKRKLVQVGNLWYLSHQAATFIATEVNKIADAAIGPDQFQSLVSSLFITGKDRGLVDDMPASHWVFEDEASSKEDDDSGDADSGDSDNDDDSDDDKGESRGGGRKSGGTKRSKK